MDLENIKHAQFVLLTGLVENLDILTACVSRCKLLNQDVVQRVVALVLVAKVGFVQKITTQSVHAVDVVVCTKVLASATACKVITCAEVASGRTSTGVTTTVMVVQQGIVLQRTTLATGVTSRNAAVEMVEIHLFLVVVAVTTLVLMVVLFTTKLVMVIMHVLMHGRLDILQVSTLLMVDLFTRVVKLIAAVCAGTALHTCSSTNQDTGQVVLTQNIMDQLVWEDPHLETVVANLYVVAVVLVQVVLFASHYTQTLQSNNLIQIYGHLEK